MYETDIEILQEGTLERLPFIAGSSDGAWAYVAVTGGRLYDLAEYLNHRKGSGQNIRIMLMPSPDGIMIYRVEVRGGRTSIAQIMAIAEAFMKEDLAKADELIASL